nr:MAG TPA: hypothetical protein [Caudoviricetes sp.]
MYGKRCDHRRFLLSSLFGTIGLWNRIYSQRGKFELLDLRP